MTASQGRTVVIGLDVGDGHLVQAWARAGHLPVLADLIGAGSFGWLATSAQTLHVSAWPSLYTGAAPGRHGVYYTHQAAPGEQGAVRFGSDQYGAPPVWEELGAAGKRCFVLDAPYTHGTKRGDVQQIFEWGTWAHYGDPGSTPAGLLAELTGSVGAHPLKYEANQIGLAALDPGTLAPDLVAAAQARADASLWCLERNELDLFWVVFSETHPAAHYLWPAGCSAQEVALRDHEDAGIRGLLDVYRAVDASIGRILDELGEEDTVLVVSGDGGGPNHAGWHLLPDVLKALGHQVAPGGQAAGPEASKEPASSGEGKRGLYARLRGLISPELRQAVSRHLPAKLRDALMKRNQDAEIDWAASRVFCLPTDLEGCLRINLRGREPAGIVEPGEEYERLCSELTASLMNLVNPRTQRPAVRRVVRSDEVHAGPRRDHLPDLIVLWEETCGIDSLTSPEIGIVEAPSPDGRTGTHRPPGFALARGPRFAPGSKLEEASVTDLAPTLFELAGVPRPEGLEGRAWGSPAG